MNDLLLLSPELVLVVAALALILVARHVRRAQPAAICVVVAAAGAIYCGWAFFSEAHPTGFAGTIAGDGSAGYMFAFEVTSIHIIIAMVGAVVIARKRED